MKPEEMLEMEKNKQQQQPLKLTAASLRELRLMYASGAIGRIQLQRLLGLDPVNVMAPAELPMPSQDAAQFLHELKTTLEDKIEHRT